MTLDEAIEHAEERARGNDQCAKDHAQLSDWLRELRRARMEIDLLKTLRNGFKADAQKYKAENAELRELVRDIFMTFCTFRETAMTDGEELRHSVRFWKRLDELGIEVDE